MCRDLSDIRGSGLAGNRDGHPLLLHHRSFLSVEGKRKAFRELPVHFRKDRVGFGKARLTVEQFGQEDETVFLGGWGRILHEAFPLGSFGFLPAFLGGQRSRHLARGGGACVV